MSKVDNNVLKVELVAQDSPVAAIATRFCERDRLTLKEKPVAGLFTRGRAFVNASTDAVRFSVKKKLFGGHVVLDPTKSPVVNFDTQTLSAKPVYCVYTGKKSDKRNELFQIAASYSPGTDSVVEVEFKDITSGKTCALSFEGNWQDRDAIFWLRKSDSKRRDAVAKVSRPEGKKRQDYEVEIASNMDAVLIALVVHILADAQATYDEIMADGPGNVGSGNVFCNALSACISGSK